MTSCGQTFDASTGNSLQLTGGALADQLWYNPGDNNYYFGFFNGIAGGKGCAVLDGNKGLPARRVNGLMMSRLSVLFAFAGTDW